MAKIKWSILKIWVVVEASLVVASFAYNKWFNSNLDMLNQLSSEKMDFYMGITTKLMYLTNYGGLFLGTLLVLALVDFLSKQDMQSRD